MKRLSLSLGLISLLCVCLVCGCAPSAKFRMESRDRDLEQAMIDRLVQRFDDFNVYTYEWRANIPAAVFFEAKNDDKKVIFSEGWRKLNSREELDRIRHFGRDVRAKLDVRLYRVMGPDDELWAFFMAAWNQLPHKLLDERTMEVFSIPTPKAPGP